MKETQALIERITQANGQFQRLHIKLAESPGRIKPGQFLLAKATDSWHPYLRDPWWPVDMTSDFLVVERPIAERYDPGQVVDVLGFVGQPYRFRRNLRNVLLIAHETPPTPLLLTVPWLLSNNIAVTLVLTGTAREYDTSHLPEQLEVIRGDDDGFAWPDQVMTAGWADQVFVAVDTTAEFARFRDVLDHFSELRASTPQSFLWGVFRPPLPCGSGACGACILSMRQGESLVCTDGPAFDLSQVRL